MVLCQLIYNTTVSATTGPLQSALRLAQLNSGTRFSAVTGMTVVIYAFVANNTKVTLLW